MKYRTLENKAGIQHYWLGVLFGLGLLLVLEQLGMTNELRSLTEKLVQPVQILAAQSVRIMEVPFQMVAISYRSYQHIQDLEKQNADLAAQVSQQLNLVMENQELRKMVNATASSGEKAKILAPILSYSQPLISNPNHTFATGDPVFIQGVFVGQIGKITQNQAEITLLSQLYQQPILAKMVSGTTGLIYGNGKDVVLKEVPIEEQLTVGELVFTAGQDGVLPNWAIGHIKEVHRQDGSPNQTAIVDQSVSFFTEKMVEVK